MDLSPTPGPHSDDISRAPEPGDLYYGPNGQVLGVVLNVVYKFGGGGPYVEYISESEYKRLIDIRRF